MPAYVSQRHSSQFVNLALQHDLMEQIGFVRPSAEVTDSVSASPFSTRPFAGRASIDASSIIDNESAAGDKQSPQDMEDQSEVAEPPIETQTFRLFDLPDELWVRIGKMAIDDSPGPITPPEIMTDALREIRPANPEHSAENPRVPVTEVFTPHTITKMFPGCFPPPPAITQTSSLLRRELLHYFFSTKIDLVFNWRDVVGGYPILVWLRHVDPLLRRVIQGVSVVGLVHYPKITLANMTLVGNQDARRVDWMEANLHVKGLYEGGGTWTDYVRHNLSLDFETQGKSGKMDFEFGDKVEYATARGIREFKQKVIFE